MIATVLVIAFISRCPLRLCHPIPESLSQTCSSECQQQTGSRGAAKVSLHRHLVGEERSRAQRKEHKGQKNIFSPLQRKYFFDPVRSLKTVKTELQHGMSQ